MGRIGSLRMSTIGMAVPLSAEGGLFPFFRTGRSRTGASGRDRRDAPPPRTRRSPTGSSVRVRSFPGP